jgi:hypothetical protein
VDVRIDAVVVTLTGQVPAIGASAKASEIARGARAHRPEHGRQGPRTTACAATGEALALLGPLRSDLRVDFC